MLQFRVAGSFRAFVSRAVKASIAVVMFTLALSATSTAQRERESRGTPGEFDYYTLVLNWSPTYCEAEGRSDYDQQCSGTRPYAFILHGLWPQYERRWPEFCRTRERPWVPQNIIDGMLDIMPSPRLVIHEYRKHGTCSGLSPRDYFDTSRRLYESIRIPDRFKSLSEPMSTSPDDIEQAFLDANPQLKPDMIEVSCSRNRLRDVRICFSKDMKLKTCGDNELGRKLCSSDRIVLPPVRGGGTSRERDQDTRNDNTRAPSTL